MSLLSTAVSTAINPIKGYLIAGAAVLLVSGAAWYHHHVVMIGEAKIVAMDQKAVAAQVERDQAVQSIASVATQLAEKKDEEVIAVPVTNAPVPVGLCRSARSGIAVPVTPGTPASGNNPTLSGSQDAGSVTELQRFANAAVQIARAADAQVTALQVVDAALRTEMLTANGPAQPEK